MFYFPQMGKFECFCNGIKHYHRIALPKYYENRQCFLKFLNKQNKSLFSVACICYLAMLCYASLPAAIEVLVKASIQAIL